VRAHIFCIEWDARDLLYDSLVFANKTKIEQHGHVCMYVCTSGAGAHAVTFDDNDITDNTCVIGVQIGRKSVRFRRMYSGDEVFLIEKLSSEIDTQTML